MNNYMANNMLMTAIAENNETKAFKAFKLGASINHTDSYGNTPLMLIAKNENITLAKMVLDMKPDLNIQNENGDTALMTAIKSNIFIASLIVDKYPKKITDDNLNNINLTNKSGNSALIESIIAGAEDLSLKILEKNPKLNEFNTYGFNAVMLAVLNNSPVVAKKIIDKGGNTTKRNKHGESIKEIARRCNRTDILDHVLKSKKQKTK